MSDEHIHTSMGSYLKEEFLIPSHLSAENLAAALSIDVSVINNIIENKTPITADIDLRLCKFFKRTNGFFLKVQNNIDLMYAKRNIEEELNNIIPFEDT